MFGFKLDFLTKFIYRIIKINYVEIMDGLKRYEYSGYKEFLDSKLKELGFNHFMYKESQRDSSGKFVSGFIRHYIEDHHLCISEIVFEPPLFNWVGIEVYKKICYKNFDMHISKLKDLLREVKEKFDLETILIIRN